MTSVEIAHQKVTEGVWKLREEYEALAREVKKWQRRAEDEKRVRQELEANPTAGTQGWHEKELLAARTAKAELETENRKFREFMKLKDNAKLKVEGQRDYWKRQYAMISEKHKTLQTANSQAQNLMDANNAQATAYGALERKHMALLTEHRKVCDEIRDLKIRMTEAMKPKDAWR